MAKTFTEFQTLIRNWANRDSEVLSDAIVADCMNYAVDKAYRVLRIRDFEETVTVTAATMSANEISYGGATYTEIDIPTDLLEIIQIRVVDEDGGTKYVFNERSDIRTFHDIYAEKYTNRFWCRIGSKILISDSFDADDTDYLEIHYYGKQGDLTDDETTHWFRDTNERVLLYGALAQCFTYLNEPDTSQMYNQMFLLEVQELNSDERKTNTKGGNTQVNFNGNGLI